MKQELLLPLNYCQTCIQSLYFAFISSFLKGGGGSSSSNKMDFDQSLVFSCSHRTSLLTAERLVWKSRKWLDSAVRAPQEERRCVAARVCCRRRRRWKWPAQVRRRILSLGWKTAHSPPLSLPSLFLPHSCTFVGLSEFFRRFVCLFVFVELDGDKLESANPLFGVHKHG